MPRGEFGRSATGHGPGLMPPTSDPREKPEQRMPSSIPPRLRREDSGKSKEVSHPRPFRLVAGNLALDFVNTVAYRPKIPRDDLRTPAEFRRWARFAGLPRDRASLRPTGKQLETIRALRESLYRLFHALARGASPPPGAMAALNARLATLARKRQLEWVRGKALWTWNAPPGDTDRILAPILFSALDLLVSGHSLRLRQCEDETCGWLFLDRSQAGRRRWCSMADCGNRAKARRHYQAHARKLWQNPPRKNRHGNKQPHGA
jgi:predicted RNA-binding Zn ribbon-like protein